MIPTHTPIVVAHIFSVSYSGSTWLNLMLGSHSKCFSVGEAKQIIMRGGPQCSLHGPECELWSRVRVEPGWNLFEQLRKLTGKQYLIVNNSRKLLSHQQQPGIVSRYIHLVRDGRAVCASFLRKQKDMRFWRAARTWNHGVKRNNRLMQRMDAGEVMHVRYEDLLADTSGSLAKICGFIGLPVENKMDQFWQHQHHHFVGGNRGTLYSMVRRWPDADPDAFVERVEKAQPGKWDFARYEKADPGQFSDERWRREFTPRQLWLFELAAGRLNRMYGYGAKARPQLGTNPCPQPM